jgi:hypothetical protein
MRALPLLILCWMSLAPTLAHARVHPQLYAGLGVAWSPGAERPVGLMLDSSLRFAPGVEGTAFEHGPFLQAGWMGGRELWAAAGVVGGASTVIRSDAAHKSYVQLDVELGAAWWRGGPAMLVGAGASKELSPYFDRQTSWRSYPLDDFQLRLGGAAMLGAEGPDPLLRATLQGAWMPRVWYQ